MYGPISNNGGNNEINNRDPQTKILNNLDKINNKMKRKNLIYYLMLVKTRCPN